MPLKKVSRPMRDAELTKWEAGRDIEAELVLSIQQMAEGKTTAIWTRLVSHKPPNYLAPVHCIFLLSHPS